MTFEKINQPAGGLRNEKAIDGLVAFSKMYSGILWVEVFIIPGHIGETSRHFEAVLGSV